MARNGDGWVSLPDSRARAGPLAAPTLRAVRAITAAGVLVLAACASGEATPSPTNAAPTAVAPEVTSTNAPSNPPPGAPITTTASAGEFTPSNDESGTQPRDVRLVAARITTADGERCDLCAWLADTPDLRARGLMEVTDLGAGAAMVFVYPAPTTTWFWMKNTPLPLSIAFFDAAGTWLESFDMAPCVTPQCPSYPTPAEFTYALEVPRGRLPDLLVGPGATLTLFDRDCVRPAP